MTGQSHCGAATDSLFVIVCCAMSSVAQLRETVNRGTKCHLRIETLIFGPGYPGPVVRFLKTLPIAIMLLLVGVATETAAQKHLTPDVEARIASAIQDLKSGNLDSAQGAFLGLLGRGIKHPLVYHNLGVIALLRGRNAEAITAFRQALALQPDNGSSRLLLGSSLLGLRKNAEAVHELRRAATLMPNEPQVHLELGTAYEAVGNWIAAVQEFQKLVKLAPQEPEFSYQLGNAWTRLADWSIHQIIDIDPNSARVHLGLGLEFAAQGKYDQALAAYQQSVRSDPKMPEVHLATAATYFELKKFDEALSEIEPEFALGPERKAAADIKAKLQAAKASSP